MKKAIICLVLVVVLSFCLAQLAQASSEMDILLNLLIKKGVITQQESEELKVKVKREVTEKPQPVTVMSATPIKGIKLGGDLEIGYQDSGGEEGTFSMTDLEPYISVDVDDHLSLYGELCFETSGVSANDIYAKYAGLPTISGDAKAGYFRRKSFGLPQGGGARVSIDFSLLGRAFTGQRQVGIEYLRSFKKIGLLGPVNLGLGVFNGGDVGNREAGDNAKRQVLFVADRAGDTDDNANKEVCFRTTAEPIKGLQIGGSALAGKLSSADLSTLNTYLSTSYTDDKKQRFGGDLTYKFDKIPLELRAEYMHGETSDLGADSWYTMAILRGIKGKLDLYSRYSQLNPDIAATSSSYSWDLQQTTLGAIWHFNKMTQLQLEYEFNQEDPGAGTSEVDNDILRIEWQTDF